MVWSGSERFLHFGCSASDVSVLTANINGYFMLHISIGSLLTTFTFTFGRKMAPTSWASG